MDDESRTALHVHMVGLSLLRETVDVLTPEGIAVMPLKGLWLQQMAYASPAERRITDVDVIVPEGTFERAEQALLRAGFRRTGRASTEGAYRLRGYSLALDLHRELFTRFAFDLPARDLFARGRRDTESFGCEVTSPDPLDVFAHLVGHFVKSRATRDDRQHLRDFSVMAERLSLDPAHCATHLAQTGLSRAARFVMPLVAEVERSAFAAQVLAALAADPVAAVLARAASELSGRLPARSPLRALPGYLLDRSLPRGALALAARAWDK